MSNKVAIYYAEGSAIALHPEFGRAPEDPTACHIDSTSGHMGKTRTLYRIKERFMWHGMVIDFVSLVSSI